MKYYSDGYLVEKNPSPIGGGYTVVNENNELVTRVDITKEGLTNNEAEVSGIISAIDLCQTGDIISSDSQTAIKWIANGLAKARPDLNDKLMNARELVISKNIILIFEGRDYNLAGIYNENFNTVIDGLIEQKDNWIV